jgi:hypothetical protein
MKQVGIWIDKREAKIVSIVDGKEHLEKIASHIEEFHAKGGSGSRLKGGPQDVVQDSKYLEREKHQFTEFFKDVITFIAAAHELVIFGPAQTGEKLHNELSGKQPKLHANTKSVEKADNMTDNQVKEWVRDYFSSNK